MTAFMANMHWQINQNLNVWKVGQNLFYNNIYNNNNNNVKEHEKKTIHWPHQLNIEVPHNKLHIDNFQNREGLDSFLYSNKISYFGCNISCLL